MIDCKSCGMDYDQTEYGFCPYCGDQSTKSQEQTEDNSPEKEIKPQEKDSSTKREKPGPAGSTFKFVIIGIAAVAVIGVAISAIFALGSGDVTVPDKYPTIQEAIDAAEDGDEIVVDVGVYRENIDFRGKNITLRSTDPDDPAVVDSTIIDGGNAGAVVSFRSGETEEAVLSGFTITRGGGLLISGGSSPLITKNIIEDNSAEVGAGIAIFDSSPTILENTITGNSGFWGGGLHVEESSPLIEGNIIQRNSAEYGSGIVIYSNASPTIINNTISENSADQLGGGVAIAGKSTPSLEGNTIIDNSGERGGGLYIEDSEPVVENNTISGNRAANGGGLFLVNSMSTALIIIGNEIADNLASFAGAGLYMEGSTPTIEDNILIDNLAERLGGGLAVYNSMPVLLRNTFESNTAEGEEGGGAIWVSNDSELDLEDPDDNVYTNNSPNDIFEEE